MEQDYRNALKCMVFGQSFVDSLDDFQGSGAFKNQLKNRGNSFLKEADKFLHSVYKRGSTDTTLIGLIEECQKAIDKVIDDQVQVVEKENMVLLAKPNYISKHGSVKKGIEIEGALYAPKEDLK